MPKESGQFTTVIVQREMANVRCTFRGRESGCRVREGRGQACRRASHRRGGKGAIHFITYFIFMPEHSATNFLVGKLPSFDMGQRRQRRRLRRFLASHGHPRDRPTVVCYSAPLSPKTASEEARREREDHHDVLCNRRRIAKIWSAAPPTGAAAGERESSLESDCKMRRGLFVPSRTQRSREPVRSPAARTWNEINNSTYATPISHIRS